MRPRHVLAGIVALLGATLSCSSSTEPTVTISPGLSTISAAASSLVADGVTQTALTVALKDTEGAAYGKSGGVVILSTTSGTLGAVADLNNGNYSATLTSSRTAGPAVISANIGGTALTATATVTFVAGPVAAIGIAIPGSNNQSAVVGATVANPPSVKVTDANGNGVSGQPVTFAVTSGGGSVTGAAQTTDASGFATVGSWRLGSVAGTNALEATTSSPAAAVAEGSESAVDRTVTFTATGVAGTPGAIALNSGDGQTAVAGTAVATAPSVKIVDGNNNPVNGAAVNFAVATGGGSITGASATTNSSGIAIVGSWTLGATAGANTITASTAGVSGLVTISATGIAGPAAIIAIANSASNGQMAVVGTAVAIPPAVKVTDTNGNAVSGVSVAFAVATGAGSLTGSNAVTNSSGVAAVGSWTLGPAAGLNSLAATSGSLSGSPVTFNATATAGAAGALSIVAGNNQSAIVGTNVATSPGVKVTDLNGNAVAGATVTFTVLSGGGSVIGAAAISDATGIATLGSWKLGPAVGTNTMNATAGGLAPVTFTATGTAGPAANIAANAGNNQSAVAGTPVGVPPSVKITDANGNAVAGTSVTFAVASGGGSVSGATSTSDANGIATVGSWTLGPGAGANSLTATSAGLAGSAVIFTATGSSGPPASIVKIDGDAQTANAGSNVPVAPSVKVTASNGDPLSGIAVVFAVATGGGSVTGGTATTNASGIATVGSWKLGNVAGGNTMTATAGSLAPVTFSAAGTVGAAALIAINAGNNQTATTGTAVGVAPSVRVSDAVGNAVSGAGVTFTVASGGGSVTGATPSTNASGIAAVGSWTVGSAAGPNTLTASLNGVAGQSVTFNATGQAAPPLGVEVTGMLERSETITVTVTQNGTPVPPSGYTLTVTPSDGATVNGDGTLKLLKSGLVTLNASASGGATGSKIITVATPPSVVFDLLNNGNRDIWRVALDGGDLQQLTTDPADDQHPSSAAGKLVFSSAREGNLHVYVQPLAGGSATRITPLSINPETEPRISPNGQRFAYISNATGTGRAIYANIDGTNPLPVDDVSCCAGAIEFGPDWAPASDKIVFGSTAAGAADIYYANTLGAVATYFPGNSTTSADLQPVYSPDASRIAFVSSRAGGTDIYVANVNGTGIVKVASNASGPAWARGDRLVFETVVFIPGQPLKGSLHWIDPSNPGIVRDIAVGAGDARNASPIF
ncbi:MAG TPA: invasin domain 3-containing protein [Gemmatimonadaceae bacterium]|nr:invasin domain 3-containing protein [Gemmatimonadaceae bacterium]